MQKRLEAMRKATQDADPSVRNAAVRSLSAAEQVADVELLVRLARSGKKQARLRAIYALSDCRGPRATAALGELVREGDDSDVRAAAASCLGARGADAASHLRTALADPDRSVAEEAIRALARLGGSESVQWIVAAAKGRSELQEAAIEALGTLGEDSAAGFLAQCVRQGSLEQQCAAAHALGHLTPEVAEEALIAAATSEQAALRRHAIEALGKLGPPALEAVAHAGS